MRGRGTVRHVVAGRARRVSKLRRRVADNTQQQGSRCTVKLESVVCYMQVLPSRRSTRGMGLVRTAQLVAYLCTTSLESVLGAMAPFATLQPADSLLPEISEPLVHAVESGAMTPHAASTMAQTIADQSAASHSRVYSAERRAAKARTAQAHRPEHRQLQEVIETVGEESKEVWTAALRDGLWGYLPDLQGGFYQDGSVCTDPRAINANQAGADSCAYHCAQLLEFYFGGDNDGKNKCFLYDEATQGWWDGGEARAGQETEMELIAAHRTSKLEWWVLLEPTDGLGDIPEFTVGEGPVCRNVTKLNTSDPAALTAALYEDPEALGSSSAVGHNETSCLLEGLGRWSESGTLSRLASCGRRA